MKYVTDLIVVSSLAVKSTVERACNNERDFGALSLLRLSRAMYYILYSGEWLYQ